MRTGIYVQQPTTVTIRASAPQDARVQLRRFRLPAAIAGAGPRIQEPDAVGTHVLEAGIYLIVSTSPMEIEGANLTTQVVPQLKNPWPDPEVAAQLVPGATAQQVLEFFSISRGIEVVDPPVPPDDDAAEDADEGDDD
jgi:hypothetical protein